jgi:hypothetical protein
MWQQATGRAISSSGLREGILARDCARRVVARSMRGWGRLVEVGIRRLRVRWIEEVVVVEDIVCCGWFGGLVSTVVVVVLEQVGRVTRWRCKVEREGDAVARDFCGMVY